MNKNDLYTILGIAACLVLTLGCIYKLVYLLYCKYKADMIVTATVIRYKTVSSEHKTIYLPIFSYEVAGKKYIEQSDIGLPYPRWDLNSQIELKCNSKKPTQFYLPKTSYGVYIMLICGIIIGILFLFLICYLKAALSYE